MWKPTHAESLSLSPSSESCLQAPAIPALESNPRKPVLANHQSAIGKGLTFVGNITGSESLESLFIEGSVQGSINLPGSRVTVAPEGQVTAGITARDIVVMGRVHGNVTASVRVDIRAEAAVTGMVSSPRISIEDGAFMKGNLDVQKTAIKPLAVVDLTPGALETIKTIRVRPQVRSLQIQPSLHTA